MGPSRLARAGRWVFAGELRVWAVAAVVAALGLALLGGYMFKPRDFVVGSNGIRVRSVLGGVGAGATACTGRLLVPVATRRLEVELGSAGAGRPPVLVTVLGGDRRRLLGTKRVPATRVDGFAGVRVDLSRLTADSGPDPAVIAYACVTPQGPGLTIGGMAAPGVSGTPAGAPGQATIDGRPARYRVTAVYLPAAGDRASIAERFPGMLERAALFRPGFVGPWLYWLLFVLILPVCGVLAVRAVACPGRRAAAVVMTVALVSGAAWAVMTVAWDAPDESEHFAYVEHLATTGTAVEQVATSRPAYSSAQILALNALHHDARIEGADGKAPALRQEVSAYDGQVSTERPSRSDGGGYAEATHLHSPAYYLLNVPAYDLAGGSEFSRLLGARLVSSLLLAVIALCAWATVRELLPRRPDLAAAAGLLVALQPVLSFLGGAVNNDMGVNAADALLIYSTIRGMRRGLTVRLGLAIGTLLVVAPLMKSTGFALYPAAGLGLLVMVFRGRRAALPGLAGAAASFVALSLAGRALKSAFEVAGPASSGTALVSSAAGTALDHPFAVGVYLWEMFLPRLPGMADHWSQSWPFYNVYLERGFGAFGWYAYLLPRQAFVVIIAVMAALLGLGLFALVARRRAVRRLGWETAVLLLVVLGVLGGVAAAYYTDFPRSVPAEQGRYAFPAAVAIAALVVAALASLPRRWSAAAAGGLVTGMATLALLARMVYLSGAFG